MKKTLFLIIIFLITTKSFSQLKKISLDDAVMQQNRLFRADKMLGFQWIPNTNKYIYFAENGKKLMSASATDSKAVEVISLSDLNKDLSSELKTFFGVAFKDSNILTISNGNKYYEYNLLTKNGKLTQELSDDSENTTFDPSKQNVAFTVNNNLFYVNSNKEKIDVTNNSDKNIVSGDRKSVV